MNVSTKKSFLLIVAALLSIYSCKKTIVDPPDQGYDYFPVRTGHWTAYQVDSIDHNCFTTSIDTFHFQLKEVIDYEYTDASGNVTQAIERYVRSSDTAQWAFRNKWTQTRTKSTAERTEDNTRYIRLVFPLGEGKYWNGNSYNTIGQWDYQYLSVNQQESAGKFSFDSTLVVDQQGQNDPIINTQFGKEIYAKRVGLIYKQYTVLYKNDNNCNLADGGGVEFTWTLIDYSK